MSAKKSSINPVWLSVIGVILITALYIYIYQAQPLPSPGNEILLNFSYGVVAAIGAAIATRIWRQFSSTDRPRAIWRNFALALWAWTVAEMTWALYYVFMGEDMPLVTLADVFWFVGYVFFAVTLVLQYRLVFHPSRDRERRVVFWAVIAVLLVSLIATLFLKQRVGTELEWRETFVSVFYPFGDLAVATAAFALARTFGWGLWGRPWIALLVFALSDALYAWLEISGVYSFLVEGGNPLSLMADVVYFEAYLIVALACYSQWLLLKYGPFWRRPIAEAQTNIEESAS